MKKSNLLLFLFLSITFTAQSQIIVTEIMYNPPESGTDSLEYIELYNNSASTVDISGWYFTQGVTHVFPNGTSMQAGAYLTLAVNPGAVQTVFGITPIGWDAGALTNGGEDIELVDANGTVIDYVDYKNATPWPTDANGNGSSLELCDYDSDNNSAGNWLASTSSTGVMINGREVYGNPNAASGCQGSGSLNALEDNFVAPADETTTLAVLTNDLFLGTVTSLQIKISPAHGNAVVVGNSIEYTPNQGYCGPDVLAYEVCNTNSCDSATVNIEVRCYPQKTIAEMTMEDQEGVATAKDQACTLQGTVYGVNLRPLTGAIPTILFTLIDDQGNGISVSSLDNDFGYVVQEKDKVTVRGVITQFNGSTEIRPDTVIKTSSNNALLNPMNTMSLNEDTESKLVRLTNLHLVDDAQWTTGTGGSGFNALAVSDDHPLDTIDIRIDRDVETYNAPVPQQPFDLIGIGGQFDTSLPYTEGYQILPRYNADISTLSKTREVDFSQFVKISPNPASELVQIDMSLEFDLLTLIGMDGRTIKSYQKPGTMQKINVSLLAPGTYFIRFEKANDIWTSRFLKI